VRFVRKSLMIIISNTNFLCRRRLVRRRLERRVLGAEGHAIPPHIGALSGSGSADIEMEL